MLVGCRVVAKSARKGDIGLVKLKSTRSGELVRKRAGDHVVVVMGFPAYYVGSSFVSRVLRWDIIPRKCVMCFCWEKETLLVIITVVFRPSFFSERSVGPEAVRRKTREKRERVIRD